MNSELKFNFLNKCVDLLLLWGKSSNEDKQLNISIKWAQYQKATNLSNNISTFVSPIYTFSLAANAIAYTPTQGTNREKYFNYINYKGKMPTLAGNKHLSVHFFLHGPRLFYLSTERVRVQSVRNGHQSGYSRADTIKNNINKDQTVFPLKEINKNTSRINEIRTVYMNYIYVHKVDT